MWRKFTTILLFLIPLCSFGEPLISEQETVVAIEVEAFDSDNRFLDGLRAEKKGELYEIDFSKTELNAEGLKEESFSYRLIASNENHFSCLLRIAKEEVAKKKDYSAYDEATTFKIQIYTEKGKIVIHDSYKSLQTNSQNLVDEAMELLKNE